jgi:hypothetical protein
MARVRSLLLAAAASLLGAPLLAQGRAVSFEASIGAGVIEGAGGHNEHVGLAWDGTIAWRVRRADSRGTPVLAVSGGLQGSSASNDICIPLPGDGCRRDYMRFYSIGALGGWEARGYRGASLRLLAGVAQYRGFARDRDARNGMGLQGRVDVTTPPLGRLALLMSVRGAVLPGFDERRYRLGAVGAGLRIQ